MRSRVNYQTITYPRCFLISHSTPSPDGFAPQCNTTHQLTSSSAFRRRDPERWEFQGCSPIGGLPVLSGAGSPTASIWWTAGHAKWPLPLSSTVYGVPVLFLPSGRQQASVDSGVSCGRFQQSARWHTRLGCGVHRLVFRILSHRWGRTGRLRRTVRNPLRSDRFLPQGKAACHVNATVGSSGLAFDRESVARSDGAYPRRERHGIAPVPHINGISDSK
jgi:hypothetical protein